MPVEPRIEVEGLKELSRNLRDLGGKEAQKAARLAGKAAADVVVDAARPKVPVRTGAAAASLRSGAQAAGATVIGGGAKVPYFGFLDYGNKVHSGAGVGRGDSQPRPYERGGRIVYPALAEKRDDVVRKYEDAIEDALRSTGFMD